MASLTTLAQTMPRTKQNCERFPDVGRNFAAYGFRTVKSSRTKLAPDLPWRDRLLAPVGYFVIRTIARYCSKIADSPFSMSSASEAERNRPGFDAQPLRAYGI